MKRLFTLTLLSAALFFTQCKKGAETVSPAATENGVTITAENKLAVQSLRSLPSQSLKKMAFKLLSPVEKYFLWLENIKTISKNFSPAQQKLATELTTFLKPRHFAESGNLELLEFSLKWVPQAEKVFTFEQIAKLAYIIDAANTVPEVAVNSSNLQTNGVAKPDCNCHESSDYSCVYFTNKSVRGDCPDFWADYCVRASFGCGFAGGFSCTNMCEFPSQSI